MAVTYSPATGISGSIQLGNYTYCASSWDWNDNADILPAPSFCGGRYQEYALGKVSGRFSFSGTYNTNVNPFLQGLKVGFVSTAFFRINNAIVASAPVAIVESWNVHDESDGLVSFTCNLIADFTFNDFGGSAA